MRLCTRLEMLGLVWLSKGNVDPQENPLLFNMLVGTGVAHADELQDRDKLLKVYCNTIHALEDELEYYDGLEMQTNEALSQYLMDQANAADICQGDNARQLAIHISCLGNKGGEFGHTDGIERLCDIGEKKLHELALLSNPDATADQGTFLLMIASLTSVFKALELTDVFIMSRLSAVQGIPEYPESSLTDLDEIPDPDFEMDNEGCSSDESCVCGCQLTHPLLIIEGLEDMLGNRDTSARAYAEGVAGANGIRLQLVAGQEGPVFDAIKELGRKAYDVAVESLKAVKGMFEEGDDEQQLEDANDTAVNNKKALQGMKTDTPARINDTARKSLGDLAASIDPSGKLKNVVSGLNTPADGARVLDALLGFMRRGSQENARDKIAEAQKAVDEIKTATDGAGRGDEENKDVVAANKSKVQESVAEAKEAMRKLKDELKQHNKWMAGLKKAIAGISPKIFIEDASKSE